MIVGKTISKIMRNVLFEQPREEWKQFDSFELITYGHEGHAECEHDWFLTDGWLDGGEDGKQHRIKKYICLKCNAELINGEL